MSAQPVDVLAVPVRITHTIANEYADRAPDFVPEACWIPGVHMVRVDSAKRMRSDAEDYASGLFFDDVRPGVRRAYGALAKQLDAALARIDGGA
jgi:hypothetical protein